MPWNADLRALPMSQPDSLTREDLIQKIQSRCRVENLELMSKEGLVGLFRRVILPLPQRFYRTNRRGKMLSSRRVKAGLEGRRKDEGCSQEKSSSKDISSNNRLKPSPDTSVFDKMRINPDKTESKSLGNIVAEDSKKLRKDEIPQTDSLSGRKIALKRRSDDENAPKEQKPLTECKRQRVAIRWP